MTHPTEGQLSTIQRWLAAHGGELCGGRAGQAVRIEQQEPAGRGTEAHLLRFRLSADGSGPCEVVVKCWPLSSPDVPDGRAAARHEYEATSRAAEVGTVAGVAAHRPLGIVEGAAAMVMPYFPGERLSVVLRRGAHYFAGRRRMATLLEWAEAGARWLRAFHGLELTEPPPTYRYDPDSIGPILREELKLCEEQGKITSSETGALGQLGESLVSRFAEELRDVCPHHGDFSPANLIVGPEGAAVIDFHLPPTAHRLFDLAYFYNGILELGKFMVYPRRKLERIGQAFLSAYDYERVPALWRLCRLVNWVEKYYSFLDARRRYARLPGRRVATGLIARATSHHASAFYMAGLRELLAEPRVGS